MCLILPTAGVRQDTFTKVLDFTNISSETRHITIKVLDFTNSRSQTRHITIKVLDFTNSRSETRHITVKVLDFTNSRSETRHITIKVLDFKTAHQSSESLLKSCRILQLYERIKKFYLKHEDFPKRNYLKRAKLMFNANQDHFSNDKKR